jgi:hypothetical protein
VTHSRVLPAITLVNPYADQMRHDVGEAVVVIAFNPHHFNLAFRIRELANVAEKLPVVFCQTRKIEISENIAEKDQSLKAIVLQHPRRFPRMTRLCTEVQVGKDQRVVHGQIHTSVVAEQCYGLMNSASKSVQR